MLGSSRLVAGWLQPALVYATDESGAEVAGTMIDTRRPVP
jgi:hypothetical protein